MRMSHVVVGTCLVRINSNDFVVTACGKRLQVQFNPEATKTEVFQVNSFGNGRKDLALGIKTNVIELFPQCHQIEKDVTGFDGWLMRHFRNRLFDFTKLFFHFFSGSPIVSDRKLSSRLPVSTEGNLDPSQQPCQFRSRITYSIRISIQVLAVRRSLIFLSHQRGNFPPIPRLFLIHRFLHKKSVVR